MMNVDPLFISQSAVMGQVNGPGPAQKTRFEHMFSQAVKNHDNAGSSPDGTVFNALLNPFVELNSQSEKLGIEALAASNNDIKPSELLMLTMQTHEFMFQCQLTSNVANRSSDGVQQLFRQQS